MGIMVVTLLRIVHVLAGAIWLGIGVFNAVFLLPSIRAAGTAGGQVMAQLVQVRRLPRYINAAMILTVATGIPLYWWRSGGLGPWIMSRSGVVFGIGGILGIMAATIGMAVVAPTAGRIGERMAAANRTTGADAESIMASVRQLQGRMLRATQVAASLLVLAAICMAGARYL